MIGNLIKVLMVKSIAEDTIKKAIKSQNDKSVVKEKLGVSTIDEFMKMDIHSQMK